MAGKTVRRFIVGLGYVVHTPASVFGRAALEQGVVDELWLPRVGREGWVVFGRDQHILDRDLELAAYLKAKVHMSLFSGTSSRAEILALLSRNLREICSLASARKPNVYWLTKDGVEPYQVRAGRRERRRAGPT